MNIHSKQKIDLIVGSVLLSFLRLPVIVLGRLMKRNHAPGVNGPILVIKMVGGGSLVLAYPALLAIRRRYQDRKIILLTLESIKPFGESLKLFDEIICIRDCGFFPLLSSTLIAWVRCFRKIDTVVDLEVYSRITTVYSVLTAARNRIGFYLENTSWRRHIHTHLLFFNRFSGSFYFYDAIAHLLDAEVPSREACADHLRVQASPRSGIKRRITIGHACSDFGMERMLAPMQWVKVLKGRKVSDEEVMFLGGKADRVSAENIITAVKEEFPALECVNQCGLLPLQESIAVIASSDEFWGIDSALLHYARLLGKKTVSFWGPTDPKTRLRDDASLASEILYTKIPCSPCIHVTETPPCRGLATCIKALFDDPRQLQLTHELFILD